MLRVLWFCGLPEEVRRAEGFDCTNCAEWSWVLGHLPPPENVQLDIICPVFGLRDEVVEFEYVGARWHCVRLKKWEPLFLRLRFYRSIRKILNVVSPDVVHGWGGETGCGLLATYCSRDAIVSVQGLLRMLDLHEDKWGLTRSDRGLSAVGRRLLERLTYSRAGKLLVESECAKNELKALYGKDGTTVWHPLRKEFLADFQRTDFMGKRGIRFLFVGELVPRKGAGDVLMAFAGLKGRDSVLTIVGDGVLHAELENKVRELGLQERVNFRWKCTAQELVSIMRESDVFVAPTYGDTGPTALKEALSQGLWPICYDNSGAAELVRRYECGELCATGDVLALGKCMEGTFDSTMQSEHLRQLNLVSAKIRNDLGWGAAWDSLRKIYN